MTSIAANELVGSGIWWRWRAPCSPAPARSFWSWRWSSPSLSPPAFSLASWRKLGTFHCSGIRKINLRFLYPNCGADLTLVPELRQVKKKERIPSQKFNFRKKRQKLLFGGWGGHKGKKREPGDRQGSSGKISVCIPASLVMFKFNRSCKIILLLLVNKNLSLELQKGFNQKLFRIHTNLRICVFERSTT
jgi:hypothetical protein